MKLSKYNILAEKGNLTYWFNGITRNYFRINTHLHNKVMACIENQGIDKLPETFQDKLLLGGFIVANETDELEIIKSANDKAINAKNYFLVVLPTLNCNYRCWYCIQDHVVSKMDKETLEKVKAHIDYMIFQEKIESLHLDWFGGEPFMYFKDVIEPLSQYAIEKCQEVGIPFMNGTTTNGYFLSEPIICKCKDLKFTQFQITLDGNQEFHDEVKFQKGCASTFKHVLKNINNLLTIIPDAFVYLRINYTQENLSEKIVEEVNPYIDPVNRERIVITPRKVWQEKVDKDFQVNILRILDKFHESGYLVEYWNPVNNYIPCYANKKYYNAISFNGKVVKCTACNDLYDEAPKGVLLENGEIEWMEDLESKYLQKSFENEKCLNCNKLPICMGLCPREHVNGQTYCKEDVLPASFEESIISFIDRDYELEKKMGKKTHVKV